MGFGLSAGVGFVVTTASIRLEDRQSSAFL